jgi:hypothetical protein
MEFDRDLLLKIRQLDDNSLRSTIENVAREMGVDPDLTRLYLSDMGKIKETVATLSEEDFLRVQSAVGEENTKVLMDTIRREVKE